MKRVIDKDELAQFLETCSPETKVYLGCDSERFKVNGKWHADYILAVVVHIDGSKGCRVFGEVRREIDYDQHKNRPFNRMMTEAMKVAQLYLDLKEVLYDFEVFVHLDISSDPKHGSNVAAQAATGYIRGVCGVIPSIKPDAWAASYAADRIKDLGNLQAVNA